MLCTLFFLLILCSCNEENPSAESLLQAQKIVEDNPAGALRLLESVPNPERMDEDDYMQYTVVKVQARYRAYQDITNDTLIFEACKYFDDRKNFKQSALAHYYISRIFYKKEQSYKELENLLLAKYYAEQASYNLLAAKSLQNIFHLISVKKENKNQQLPFIQRLHRFFSVWLFQQVVTG